MTKQELSHNVDAILREWLEAERAQVRNQAAAHRETFARFCDWMKFYGMRWPVSGHIVAGYLLEIMADGAPLDEIKRAATAVAFHCAHQREYLDLVPVKAALALAAAQLDPNRVLN